MLKARTGRAALAALLTIPVLALLGCAAAATEVPVSPPASAPMPTATPTPTSTATPTTTPQSQAAEPVWPNYQCQDEQLAAELVDRPDLSAANREGYVIVLTNVSEQSCSYYGWPGVLLLGADGTTLTSRDDNMMGALEPEPGALAPGESFQVEALLTEVGTYDCTPATATTIRVLVTSDGAGPGIDAPADLQVCGDARSDFSAGPSTPVP
jgi:membrane-bound inhibitor of C-type lysozyme